MLATGLFVIYGFFSGGDSSVRHSPVNTPYAEGDH